MNNCIRCYYRTFAAFSRLHLRAAMEYRRAFWLQVIGMMLNNGAFVFFWQIIFHTFSASFAAMGVKFSEIMLVWALASTAFGAMHILFAGSRELSSYITSGKLDVYLLYPKHPVYTTAISQSHTSAWGDLAYGYLLYFIFVPKSIASFLLFTAFTAMSGVFLAAVMTAANCLSFWWGNADDLAQTLFGGLLSFGIYPERIFPAEAKFLLFSVLPVGFYIYLPVRVIMHFDLWLFLAVAAATALAVLLALLAFKLGLRRYESGNLFTATR